MSNSFFTVLQNKKNLQFSYFLSEGQIMKKTDANIKRIRKSILQLNVVVVFFPK